MTDAPQASEAPDAPLDFEAALAQLTSSDIDACRTALARLVEEGAAGVPRLVEALEKSPSKSRKWVANALRKLGTEAAPAVPALARALESRDRQLVRAATRALRGIGKDARDATPVLLRALDDRDSRHWALLAIVAVAPDIELPKDVLREATTHRRHEVRKWARERVGE